MNQAQRRGSVVVNIVSLFAGQGLSRLLALVFYMLLARVFGPELFGYFAVGVAFGTLLAVLIEPGLNAQLIREGARSLEARKSYAADSFRYKIIAIPIAVLLLLLIALMLGYRERSMWAITTVGSSVVIAQLDEFVAAALASCERLDVSAGLRLLTKVLTAGLAGLAALLGASFEVVCLSFMLGSLASVVFGLSLVHLRFVPFKHSAASQDLMHKIREGIPLALAGALWMVTLRLDQVMASMFGVAAADIGGYNAAIKLKEALIMVPAIVAASFTPVLSRLIEDDEAVKMRFKQLISWGIGGAVPVSVGAVVLAAPILTLLFGDSFSVYGTLVRISFVAYLANAVIVLFTSLVVARHHYSLQAKASIAVLLGNVLLNAVFIPFMGMQGAAIATAISTAFGALVLFSEIWRSSLSFVVIRAFLHSFAASLPMAVIAYYIKDINVILSVAAGVLVYALVFLGTGGAGPEFYKKMRSFLSPAV